MWHDSDTMGVALKTCLEQLAKVCIRRPGEGELAEQSFDVCLLENTVFISLTAKLAHLMTVPNIKKTIPQPCPQL